MLEWLIENNVVCHALEAMIFASVACSILGVIISRMSLSSIGFTMSHAAFAGAADGADAILARRGHRARRAGF